MRHVMSMNSSLKPCINLSISQNLSESFKIYFICKIVTNIRNWIFYDFDTLVNIGENGCTWKKTDIPIIRYIFLFPKVEGGGGYILIYINACTYFNINVIVKCLTVKPAGYLNLTEMSLVSFILI